MHTKDLVDCFHDNLTNLRGATNYVGKRHTVMRVFLSGILLSQPTARQDASIEQAAQPTTCGKALDWNDIAEDPQIAAGRSRSTKGPRTPARRYTRRHSHLDAPPIGLVATSCDHPSTNLRCAVYLIAGEWGESKRIRKTGWPIVQYPYCSLSTKEVRSTASDVWSTENAPRASSISIPVGMRRGPASRCQPLNQRSRLRLP